MVGLVCSVAASPHCWVPVVAVSFDCSELAWDAATVRVGVRLSCQWHSMLRDALPSLSGALGVACLGQGSTSAFHFRFLGPGRAELLMVGVALLGQARDGRPAARWGDRSDQGPGRVAKVPLPWGKGAESWDGENLCLV